MKTKQELKEMVCAAIDARRDEIIAFASTSNTLTNADGLYMSLLIGLPLTEWMYKKLSKNHPQKGVKPVEAAPDIVVEKEDI